MRVHLAARPRWRSTATSVQGQRIVMRTSMRSASKLGQYNKTILREIVGLTDAEIEELVAAGVVGTLPAELVS